MGTPRPVRPPAEDRPIRRTWWLLSGAFLLVGLITAGRALGSGDTRDWLLVGAVAFAALAAILHRNAVGRLEARGREEAENFARILQGLSRSVSVDAIVGAIVDDLADGTGADHVVVVRRRPEGGALEVTLVTSRAGVPSSSTVLPLADLDAPLDREPPPAIPVPMAVAADRSARERRAGTAVALAPAPRAGVATAGASAGRATGGVATRGVATSGRIAGVATSGRATAARSGTTAGLAERSAAWIAEFAEDLGLGLPFRSGAPRSASQSEVLGTGRAAAVTARVADRVRSLYGLSHTLAAPLRTDAGLVGAIVLSRRDREPWPVAARRLLEGAAVEAAAAMARAYSHREATANASTDPLTGLPNRRYFDEFCGLLARRRRAGDAVAVLMIDIDRFKVLNDTYGHPVGDEVLRAVAGAIVTAVREEDVPARIGGEEFAVLLRNPGPDIATEVGERVRQQVRGLDLRGHGVAGVSVSVGVANAGQPDEPILEIVDRADQALLRAKRAGRDRVVAA